MVAQARPQWPLSQAVVLRYDGQGPGYGGERPGRCTPDDISCKDRHELVVGSGGEAVATLDRFEAAGKKTLRMMFEMKKAPTGRTAARGGRAVLTVGLVAGVLAGFLSGRAIR